MGGSVERWDHAARVLRDRMEEVGVTQTRLASDAGVSSQVLRDLRTGVPRQYHAAGLAKIAVALGWPSDAFQRLRYGGPVEERRRMEHDVRTDLHLFAGQLMRRIDAIERDLVELREEIVRALRVDGLDDEKAASTGSDRDGYVDRRSDVSRR